MIFLILAMTNKNPVWKIAKKRSETTQSYENSLAGKENNFKIR